MQPSRSSVQSKIPYGRIVRSKVDLFRAPIDRALDRLWSDPDARGAYTRFIVHTHQVIRASVPLMEVARRRALELAPADPVCAPLADYLAAHIEEERGHDAWAKEDLEVVAGSSDALAATPPACVAAAVGAQYYWIFHHHPVTILGYIAVLEDGPDSAGDFFRVLMERTGFPEAAFRALRHHVELDPAHRRDLYDLFDRLPLSALHKEAIGVGLVHTAIALAECIDGLPSPSRR
jgi:hypothetical protein